MTTMLTRFFAPLRAFWRSRLRPLWDDYEWVVISCLALLALVLGYLGFRDHFAAVGEKHSFSDLLYLSLQLFVLQSGAVTPPVNLELDLARWLAPLVSAYAAVHALVLLFSEQIRSFRLRFVKDHVIICGLGDKGHLLAKGFIESGARVVIIEEDEKNNRLEQCLREGATKILFGNAPDVDLLRKAEVQRAKYLISVCGDDGDNAEVADRVRGLVKGREGRPLTCLVHIATPELYHLCRQRVLASPGAGSVRLEFFNVFDSGARSLLNEFPIITQACISGPCQPQLVVVGSGPMARSLVFHAAAGWRVRFAETGNRLKITLVDADAPRAAEALSLRFSLVRDVCDLTPLAFEIGSADFLEARFLSDATAVYVCCAGDADGLSAALSLHGRLKKTTVPIVLCVAEKSGLAALVHGNLCSAAALPNLRLFGLLDRTCNPDLLPGGTHEVLARLLHEDYVQARKQAGAAPGSLPPTVPWDKLSDEFKESNRLEADHISVKLEAVGCAVDPLTDYNAESFRFSPAEVETMARMEHERFRAERFLNGWTCGPVRDDAAKINPNLVPWEDLPEGVREYNRETIRKIPAFLARADLQVSRLK